MSKRTNAIYKSLENLEIIQKAMDDGELSFRMSQELKNLKFWIDSLYRYNGKSTSIIKKTASAENGKKGGRPPKEISQAKMILNLLENTKIPELDHKIVMADSNEELNDLKLQREKAFDQIQECRNKIKKWQEK